MKLFRNTNLYSRLALTTSVTLVVGYFVVYAAWTNLNLSDVDSGKTITATLMQSIVNKINDVGTRTDGIYSSAGNIGIGTASPNEKVRIALTGNANAKTGTNAFGSAGLTYLQFDTTTTNNEVGIFGGHGMGSLSAGIGFARENDLNWGMQLRFYTKQTTVTTTDEVTERMRIMGDGNVGIGTTNPTQKLDVNGKIAIHSTITTSLIGNIRMEDNLFKIVTPSQKQWDFRDDGSIWFYDGNIWTKKSL
ncbi:MAG: hypothetical protein Q8K26_01235 [Candidatus Gracilibacteria bacterium]|nr:hypothetical protein [Candidatus Gracilibacteria bacterium]